MGVKIIRSAICDRCGKECSCIQEKIIKEKALEHYDIKTKVIAENVYHYTEVSLRGFDSHFGDSTETTFVLCGKCVSDLGDFLKVIDKNGR